MARNVNHDFLPQPDGTDLARQRFVLALKGHVGRKLRPHNRTLFEQRAAPAYEKSEGEPAEDRRRMAEAMGRDSLYQTWSALNRTAQELLWETVGETVLRSEPDLKEKYAALPPPESRRGSLDLDPSLPLPNAMQKIQVHLQPGGYVRDEGEDDLVAGALYEAGGSLYSRGNKIGVTESKAECMMRFMAERYPELQPKRILDIACSAGSNSTPYALAFPDAEMHAIDVGPGHLRYAHARAEALGAAVHFHQRRAEDIGFEDGSFDLVVSHNAMHEMSGKATAAMFRESYRLLRPGGVCIHQDVPLRYEELDEYLRFDYGWDLKNNNEPFWEVYATNDCPTLLAQAGFDPKRSFVGKVPQIDGTISWFVASAQK